MQSGSSLNSWASTDESRANAFALGKLLDAEFNSTDSKDLLKLLQDVNASDILSATKKVRKMMFIIVDKFWMVVTKGYTEYFQITLTLQMFSNLIEQSYL